MFRARTDEEDALLRLFGGVDLAKSPTRPLDELVRLSESEFDAVRDALAARFEPFHEAYLRGMAVAHTDEQMEVLAELKKLLGEPRIG